MLDTVGDGSGTKDANGDYSGEGAEQFLIAPGTGEIYKIARMIGTYSDTTGFSPDEYGNLNAALTNGISMGVYDGSGIKYWLTDEDNPVKTNSDWVHYCYDWTLFSYGTGNDRAGFRWTFAKSGSPVTLNGNNGEYLAVNLNDDLTGLVDQHFLVQGVIVQA